MKKIIGFIFIIIFAVVIFSLIGLIAYTFITENDMVRNDLVTFVSLLALLISFPTLYSDLKDIYYPNKKIIKLTGKCPNCKSQVNFQLEEK